MGKSSMESRRGLRVQEAEESGAWPRVEGDFGSLQRRGLKRGGSGFSLDAGGKWSYFWNSY
ncbi:MAG: hypothetical protein WHX93_10695 [bacterium]